MITLTRLDGSNLSINPDLIETIEETPDTHLTLSNGNRYLVLEKTSQIVDKIMVYKARIMRRAAFTPSRKYLQKIRQENYRLVCPLEK